MKRALLCILFLLSMLPLSAGDGYRRFDARIRNWLMGGMDSSYVCLPSTSWEVPVAFYVNSHLTSMLPQGGGESLALSPWEMEIGAGVGYHGLDLIYSFSLDRKSDNFYFDYYDNYWGASIYIGNYAHNVKDPAVCDLRSHSMMLSAYYAVFGNRYSHPATIYGNYIQKRSAGSPIISVWYDYHSYRRGNVDLPGFEFDDSGHLARFHQGAVTAGYGYNLAFLDGRIVLNATLGVGVAYPWALAVNSSAGAIFRIHENVMFNLVATSFWQKSWSARFSRFESNTLYGAFMVTYCFGK